jgi:hypothetical protein
MLSDILTHPLFLASALSFFIGSFSYILVRLWLRPVTRYVREKRKIQIELSRLCAEDSGEQQPPDLPKRLRQSADALTAVYHGELPYWYRLLLEKRGEDPIQAATLLMKLANTHTTDHARQQVERIKTFLKLS